MGSRDTGLRALGSRVSLRNSEQLARGDKCTSLTDNQWPWSTMSEHESSRETKWECQQRNQVCAVTLSERQSQEQWERGVSQGHLGRIGIGAGGRAEALAEALAQQAPPRAAPRRAQMLPLRLKHRAALRAVLRREPALELLLGHHREVHCRRPRRPLPPPSRRACVCARVRRRAPRVRARVERRRRRRGRRGWRGWRVADESAVLAWREAIGRALDGISHARDEISRGHARRRGRRRRRRLQRLGRRGGACCLCLHRHLRGLAADGRRGGRTATVDGRSGQVAEQERHVDLVRVKAGVR